MFGFALSARGWGESLHPLLAKGVISYTAEDGRRQEISVGKPCSDLWVSPDERVMVFITIEKAEPPTAWEIGPFIEESSIYIAWKSDHFRPVRLGLKSVSIGDRGWKVFRYPSLSPDLGMVYFQVPYTMTVGRLMSCSLSGDALKTVGDVGDYCVIWGGAHSGDLLTMRRQDAPLEDPNRGVTYPCYHTTGSGDSSMIADGVTQSCWVFDRFATRWTRAHGGGACRAGWNE